MQYEVIDNYLSLEEFTPIRDLLMGGWFPWFFSDTVTYNDEDNNPYYFAHKFYDDHAVNSQSYTNIRPLIAKIAPKSIIRIKANLYPNMGKLIENSWHTDYPFEHKGAIFYINDNNGYTILEDGTKIESRANRILFFDASKQHKSTHCTDVKSRVNINLNYF
jgi:hypothetical protein